MFSSRFPASFLTLTCGCMALAVPALPVCEVQTSAQLDEYRINKGARGLLSIKVHCPDTIRYMLRIESGGLPLQGPNAHLRLTSSAHPDIQARQRSRACR